MKQHKIQWHPAFCSALKLELKQNRSDLNYHTEYSLSSLPLKIDILIITRTSDVFISNEIGHIFRKYNIFEYKSPEAQLNIDTFYKVMGYACLYKANGRTTDSIKSNEITISFVREHKPEKLFHILSQAGASIVQNYDGIYYVNGILPFKIQVIVSDEINADNHIWISALTKNLTEQNVDRLLESTSVLTQVDEKEFADSVLQVAMKSNETVFLKTKEVPNMCEALRELMKPEIEEELRKARADAIAETRKEMADEIAKLMEERCLLKERLKILESKQA